MTVYIDVVLFENIAMNYIIILASAIIGNRKVSFIRVLIASFLGGIYSIVNYLIKVSTFTNIILKILISIIMIKIAFKNGNIKSFFKILVIFYMVSLTIGGAAFMLLFFVNPKGISFEDGHLVGTYPIKITILGAILGFTIISIVNNILKRKLTEQICDIEIFYQGKNTKVRTFIDSGNLLKEPISQTDVIIVEKESLCEIVDKEFLENTKNILKGNLITFGADEIRNKIKIIPFSSLGNENGMLVGFKPDYIKIYNDDVKVTSKVIVGIYDGKLTKTNLYTSLIGLNILKESDVNDKFIANT